MADFNWEQFNEVKETTQPESAQSDFNWDSFAVDNIPTRSLASEVESLIAKEKENLPNVSPARSALVGAGQGATLGFAEELTAPLAAGAGMALGLPSENPEESTWDKYQRLMQLYRDTAREEQKSAQEQQPGAYTAGVVGGSLLSPGLGVAKVAQAVKGTGALTKAAVGATTGAGLGALSGTGEAEGSLEERLPGTIEGAKIGGITGGALPLAAGTAKSTAKLAGEVAELPMVKRGIEAFKRGVKGENLYTERGLKEAEEGVYKQSEKLYSKIQEVKDQVGKQIESKIKQADESGAAVDLSDVMDNAYRQLDELEAGNPGQETISYIRSLRSELNQLFGIKPQTDEFLGVAKTNLPEGIITPAKTKPSFEVTPSKAREIKQNMYGYTPSNVKTQTGTVSPLVSKPANVAQDVYSGAAEGLEEAVGGLEANQKYSIIKDTLKRLLTKEKQFEEMDVEKITDMLKKIEDPNAGKSARLFEWTMQQLDEVDPKIRKEFEGGIRDSVDRYKLAKDIQSGGIFSGILGTKRSLGGTSANIAGIIAGKTGLATAGSATGQAVKTFTNAVLNKPETSKSIVQSGVITQMPTKLEPHVLQRKVAAAAENAEPEFLKDQAEQIRQEHGEQGEQLATVLEKMADKNKDARRALMFTILQNQAYRKMLGLQDEQIK
jgi:hypothetical protein